MKKLLTILTSRLFVVSALILLQLGLLIFGIVLLQGYSVYCYLALVALSWVLVFYILSKRDNPMYKLAWIPSLQCRFSGGSSTSSSATATFPPSCGWMSAI